MVKFAYKKLIFLFGIFFLSSCALQLPPGGGKVDKVPPEIIEVYPSDRTVFYEKNYFELKFSEFVDKRTVRDAIFISPAIAGALELNWSGKSVRISFPTKLREATTYNITIGTDVVDFNNRNRMANSFSFSFSTGSFIDYASISGKVFDDKPSGVMIYAYRLLADTLNPSKHNPDYISQVGGDGLYNLKGLAFGNYRVFAVKDEFRDLLFQSHQDMIGVASQDINLTETDSAFNNLDFLLAKIDTVPPIALSVVMTDANHLLLNLSEPINLAKNNFENFLLKDSAETINVVPKYFFKGRRDNDIVLVIENKLENEKPYFLITKNLVDELGNKSFIDTVHFNANMKLDTIAPTIVRANPSYNSNRVDFLKPSFQFYFNDAFDFASASNQIILEDTSRIKVIYSVEKIDDASIQINAQQKLNNDEPYQIRMNFNYFKDAAGNSLDSIYIFRFRTITGFEFTGLSGIVDNFDISKNPFLILNNMDDPNFVYSQKIDSLGKFDFTRIEPGKYSLKIIYDLDRNKKFTEGFPFPFKPSEFFKYFPEIINLPPRWNVTDLIFDLKD